MKRNFKVSVFVSGLPPRAHGHLERLQPFLHSLHKAQHGKGLFPLRSSRLRASLTPQSSETLSYFTCRIQACSAQRSSLTSWGILGCWRRWRSVGLGSLSAELLKTSSPGWYLEFLYFWDAIAEIFLLPCLTYCYLVFFLPVRYKIIVKDKVPAAGDDKKRSTDLLIKYDKTKKEWQLGKTKVILITLIRRHHN